MKNAPVVRFNSIFTALLLSVFLLASCHSKDSTPLPAISAIPPSSPIFLKINDAELLCQSLGEQNKWWSLMANIAKIKPLYEDIASFDSLLQKNPELKSFLKDKEVLVSLSLDMNKRITPLIIIPVDISGEQKKAQDIFTKFLRSEGLTATKFKYNRASVYAAKLPNGQNGVFYSFKNKLLFITQNQALLEETIDHLEKRDKEQDHSLEPLLKTSNKQAQINIFVNHLLASEILSLPLSDLMKERCDELRKYSSWSGLDITVKDQKAIISGFSNSEGNNNLFSKVLQNQQPGISTIERVLPANTAYFSGYILSSPERFFNDLASFRTANGETTNEKSTKYQRFLNEIIDGEMALASISNNPIGKEKNSLFAVKTKSGSFTLERLKDLIKSEGQDIERKEYKVDNQTSIEIFRSPNTNLLSIVFGTMFVHAETKWFTIYGNYLLFSDSFEMLGKAIISNILGETLMDDNEYSKFQSGLSAKSNFNFYCNTSISLPLSNLFFSDDISQDIVLNEEFRKFRHFSWQVSSSGNMVYNNSCFVFDEQVKFKPQTVWQSKLAAPVACTPLIIENKYDSQESKIVLFDTKNNLYLINNVGRIVWQMNTGSPIISSIETIDMGKKGNVQLVLNTKEKLFVIDMDGEAAKNFPVTFKIPASNGVSVFDYEKNHNYRFFIAGEDQLIYAYDEEGQPVEGWQPAKTDHPVTKPVQHFSVEGKDYIVASDRMKDYIFDRKGNIRVETNYVYQHSANNNIYLERRNKKQEPRLVSTDSQGSIQRTFFDGKHESVNFNQLDDSHYFVAANVDEEERNEYIFTNGSQLIIQKEDADTLAFVSFPDQLTERPQLFSFSSKDKKIGAVSARANKIYLLNSNGSLHKGFPLDGCTGFSIGFIGDDKSRFNLYVGSPDGYLYNYLVE